MSGFFDIIHQDPILSNVSSSRPLDLARRYQSQFPGALDEWTGAYPTRRRFWKATSGCSATWLAPHRLRNLYEDDGRIRTRRINSYRAHGFTLRDLVSYRRSTISRTAENRDGSDDNRRGTAIEGETTDETLRRSRKTQRTSLT